MVCLWCSPDGRGDVSSVLATMQVADICVSSLLIKEAENKVVEVIATPDQPMRSLRDLFASV